MSQHEAYGGFAQPFVAGRRRPGVLTAVGVISLVVACISGMACFGFSMQALMMYRLSTMATAFSPPPAAPAPAASPAPTAATPSTSNADDSDSQSADSQSTPPTGDDAKPATPTNSGGGSTPAPGAGNTGAVNVSVSVTTFYNTATTAPTPSFAALTPQQVNTVVAKIQNVTGSGVNLAQRRALRRMLQQPQDLLDPNMAWSPVQAATTQPDGSLTVTFNGSGMGGMGGGMVMLAADGSLTQQTTASSVPNPFAGFRMQRSTMLWVVCESGVSLLLDVFLLIAGIQILRDSRGARRDHLIYAALKVPLAIVGGWAIGMMYGQMMAIAPVSPVGVGNAVAFTQALTFGGLALLYPIALLITFNVPPVREYYRPSPHNPLPPIPN